MTLPSAKTSIDQRREDLRGRILDAALELFAERGYHGTSIPAVLERAAIGAGSLYRLFESKEALVNAVFREAKGRLERALRDGLSLDGEPRALFDAFWSRLASFAQREPVTFRFLELQDHTPYLDTASRAQELSVLAPIALGVLDFQRRGAFVRDVTPDVIIAFVWGAFVGLVKAARLGYLQLGEVQLQAARDACFRAFSAPSAGDHDGPKEQPKEPSRRTSWSRRRK